MTVAMTVESALPCRPSHHVHQLGHLAFATFDRMIDTVRDIRQNLFFAFIYNALGVAVAAGVLSGILLSPIIAAAAMALSSVSVIANAVRLRAIRL